jgi:predicted RNA-binding protein
MAVTYWLDLFTVETWEEFQNHGASISGFSESRWSTVQKMKKGDKLLCYLTGISRFVGVLEVDSDAFRDSSAIWTSAVFPSRVRVKPLIALRAEYSIPVTQFRDSLTVFQGLKNPNAWTGHFRGSPRKWDFQDGELIEKALLDAQKNPIHRPFKLKKQKNTSKLKKSNAIGDNSDSFVGDSTEKLATLHEQTQLALLRLGSDMGLNVWVAQNDRNKVVDGSRFSEIPKMMKSLPIQFDEVTSKTIKLIDVLWLKGNSIVAAFEIESTTSIYSGLLRMSDLISMQPNLSIPLFIVADETRRTKTLSEVNRPTFSKLATPLSEICRFISIQNLLDAINKAKGLTTYLKPEFLDEISESCDLAEDEAA